MTNLRKAQQLIYNTSIKPDISDLDIYLLRQKLIALKQVPLTRVHLLSDAYVEIKQFTLTKIKDHPISRSIFNLFKNKRLAELVSTSDYTQNAIKRFSVVPKYKYRQSINLVVTDTAYISLTTVIHEVYCKTPESRLLTYRPSKATSLISRVLKFKLDYKHPDWGVVLLALEPFSADFLYSQLMDMLKYIKPQLHKDYLSVLEQLTVKLKQRKENEYGGKIRSI